MKILENIQSIGFILFHTRKDEGQHLFTLKSSCEVRPQASLDDSVYMNISTTNLYLLVAFDSSAELDSSSIHSSKASWTKQSRYDAQYVSLETIRSIVTNIAIKNDMFLLITPSVFVFTEGVLFIMDHVLKCVLMHRIHR